MQYLWNQDFCLHQFENPEILSAVSSTDGIRVLESNSQQYYLSLNNETFTIDYSFSNGDGQITKIDLDSPTATMTFQLETPEDSQLSIIMPKELFQLVFYNDAQKGYELAISVDDENVEPNQQVNSNTGDTTFVIPLRQGSETLEIVGTFPI